MRKNYIYIYRNRHKNCWSIKEVGKKIQHAKELIVRYPLLQIYHAGWKRTFTSGKRNVHAYIVTTKPRLIRNKSKFSSELLSLKSSGTLHYNPNYDKYFYFVNNNVARPIRCADNEIISCAIPRVHLNSSGLVTVYHYGT